MTPDQSREAFEALRDDIRNHRTISAIVHLDRLEAGWQAARQAEREAVLEEAAQIAENCWQPRKDIADGIRAIKRAPAAKEKPRTVEGR